MTKAIVAKEIIEVRVPKENVWRFWEKAHQKNGQTQIEKGQKSCASGGGKSQFKYEILDAIPYEKFVLQWKTLFVRLIFTHEVKTTRKGSEICYQVELKGFFGAPVRWMLGGKIRQNIVEVLKAIARQLENEIKT